MKLSTATQPSSRCQLIYQFTIKFVSLLKYLPQGPLWKIPDGSSSLQVISGEIAKWINSGQKHCIFTSSFVTLLPFLKCFETSDFNLTLRRPSGRNSQFTTMDKCSTVLQTHPSSIVSVMNNDLEHSHLSVSLFYIPSVCIPRKTHKSHVTRHRRGP